MRLRDAAKCIHFRIQRKPLRTRPPAHPERRHVPPAATSATAPRKPAAPRTAARAGRRSGPGDRAPAGTTQRIVDSITTAIVERRLMPGTKLAEQQIADIFERLAHARAPGAEPAEPRPPGDARAGARRLRRQAQRRRGAPGLRGARHARGGDGAAAVRRDHGRADRRAARAPEGRGAGRGAHRRRRAARGCWPTSTWCWRACSATRCWPSCWTTC